MIEIRRSRTLLVVGAAAVALLGLRAAHFARHPAFAVALPYRTPAWFRFADVRFVHPVAGGELRIRAGTAQPGHEELGYFRLGPSSFLDLRDVEVALMRRDAIEWRLTAATARLGAHELSCAEQVVVTEAGERTSAARLRISLRDGRRER